MTPMLERDHALDRLRSSARGAAAGAGRVVALLGEAGTGKTTLLGALANAIGTDFEVVWGACEDLSIPETLGPLWDFARALSVDLEQAEDQQRLKQFGDLLDRIACSERPVALFVEDLHWADEATVDFVRFLARRIALIPALLVITSRNGNEAARRQIRHAFSGVSPEVLDRISVEPLSFEAVATLAVQAGRDGQEIYAKTGGNAFLVSELLQHAEGEIPMTVQDAILDRVDRLSVEAHRLAEIVSIFPRRAETELATRMDGGVSIGVVEECLRHGLLQSDMHHLVFRHEIARQAVEMAISPLRRKSLNAELTGLLQGWPDVSGARLMHHARAGGLDDLVSHLAPQLGRDALKAGAFREAAGYFRLAFEHQMAMSEAEEAELLEDAAKAFQPGLDISNALACLEKARSLRERRGELRRASEALRRMSRLEWEIGNKQKGRELGDRAIAIIGEDACPELAWAYASRAQIAMSDYAAEECDKLLAPATALAETLNLDDVRCHLMNTRAMNVWRAEDRLDHLFEESLALARKIGDHFQVCRGYSNHAIYSLWWCEYDDARQQFDQGIEHAARYDFLSWEEYMRVWRAHLLIQTGDWDAALETIREERAETWLGSSARFMAVLGDALLATRCGRPDNSEDLAWLLSQIKEGEDFRHVAEGAYLFAERAWLGLGGMSDAADTIDRAISIAEGPTIILAEIFAWCRRLGLDRPMPHSAERLGPHGLTIMGDWREAAGAWAEIGNPYNRALALVEGDADALTDALMVAEGLGASALSDRLRQAASTRGVALRRRGPRASTQSNPAGLTLREMDVLQLVSEGLTNSEIAEALFVSPKTVDHHVSAVLGKLSASSRAQAAAKARDLGLV